MILALTATSNGVLFYSESIMTEIPYLCLSLLVLLCIHQRYGVEPRPRWSSVVFILISTALAYLTRPVGFALIAVIVVYLLVDVSGSFWRRVRRAAIIGAAAFVNGQG